MLQLDSISTLKLEKQEATHRAEGLAAEVATLTEQAALAEHALAQLVRRAAGWGAVKDGAESSSAAEELAVAQVTAVAQASVKRMQVRQPLSLLTQRGRENSNATPKQKRPVGCQQRCLETLRLT